MANVLLTSYCNRRCAYCFAKQELDAAKRHCPPNMAPDDFRICLDWFERSRLSKLSILGGEPTLHPQFTSLLAEAIARKTFRQINVFTNGFMPDSVVHYLASAPRHCPALILNINEPCEYTSAEWARLETVISTLHDRIALGFNLYRSDCDLDFLLDLYLRHRVQPHLRLGLTQPILGAANRYLPTAAFLPVAEKLVAVAGPWAAQGLHFSFDCGFPFCMFSVEQHKILLQHGMAFRSLCDPIIDIGTDLRVWRCFPHSSQGDKHLGDFEMRMDAVRYFQEQERAFRQFGIYGKCNDCVYRKQEMCCGGCLARVVGSFHGRTGVVGGQRMTSIRATEESGFDCAGGAP